MKIAVFSDAYVPQVNGVVTHLLSTIPLLAAKHKISLFVPGMSEDIPKPLQHENISVNEYVGIPMPIYEKILLTSPFDPLLFNSLKKFNPDVLHVHTPFTLGANGVIAARRYNIPLIETFHTYVNEPEYLRHFKLNKIGMEHSPIAQEAVWSYLDMFYKPADVLICPSDATRRDLLLRYPHKDIMTISNGINLDTIVPKSKTSTKFRQKFNIDGEYFLYIGRVSVEKNLHELIDAYLLSELHKKNISLVIVGDGNEFEKISQHVANAQKQNIILLRTLPHDEIITSGILHHALAFVSASTSETQGISFLEGMAAGLPLIVAQSKASSELVNGNGIRCKANSTEELAAAMIKIASEPKLRTEFAKASLQLIKKHSIDLTINLLEEAYKKAITSHALIDSERDSLPLEEK